MKQLLLTFLLLFGFGLFADAQTMQPPRNQRWGNAWTHPNYHRAPTLSIGFEIAAPRNEFDRNFDGVPVGFGAQFLTNSGRRSPFELGVGFSWLSRGSAKEDVFIYEGLNIDNEEVFSKARMSVNSNIYTYNGIARFKPLLGKVQPYVDGLVGVRNFSTTTIIRPDDNTADPIKERQTRDFALTYGWAAGVKVRLTQSLMVEGRFSNLFGTQVQYVDRNTIEVDQTGAVNFETKSSRTDMHIYHLGVCFEF